MLLLGFVLRLSSRLGLGRILLLLSLVAGSRAAALCLQRRNARFQLGQALFAVAANGIHLTQGKQACTTLDRCMDPASRRKKRTACSTAAELCQTFSLSFQNANPLVTATPARKAPSRDRVLEVGGAATFSTTAVHEQTHDN